jgi:hypothetical protein
LGTEGVDVEYFYLTAFSFWPSQKKNFDFLITSAQLQLQKSENLESELKKLKKELENEKVGKFQSNEHA